MTARLALLALAMLMVGCGAEAISPSAIPSGTAPASPESSASASAAASIAASEAPSAAIVAGTLLRVQNPGLRIRADPRTDGDLLRALPEGAVVSVISGPTAGEGHDWYEVRHGDLTGWVASGEERDWLAVIRNGRIGFACVGCTENRAGSLMTIEPDGSDPQLIYDNFAVPVWSPDGSQLAISVQPTAGDSNNVWVVTPGGEILESLGEGYGPTWSPDGSQLAFIDPFNRAISFFIDGEQMRITVSDHAAPSYLRWSPDGQRMAFVAIDCPECPANEPIAGDPPISVFAFEPPGGAIVKLADGGNTGIVDWSADGSVITFIELNLGTGDLEIRELDLALNATTVRLGGVALYGYAISPDESRVAIGTEDGIVTFDRNGEDPITVVPYDGVSAEMPQQPRWSPDGQWILYDIVATQGDARYPAIVRADGTDGLRLVEHDGYEANWQPLLEALP